RAAAEGRPRRRRVRTGHRRPVRRALAPHLDRGSRGEPRHPRADARTGPHAARRPDRALAARRQLRTGRPRGRQRLRRGRVPAEGEDGLRAMGGYPSMRMKQKLLRTAWTAGCLAALAAAPLSCSAATSHAEQGEALSTGNADYDAFFKEVVDA